jgi:transcriptional regulator with XRE-family HTH domain
MHLGEWLQQRGMKQNELADQIGISPSVVSRTINEKRPPSAELRWAFARQYGMAEAEAVFGNGREQVEPEPA